MENDKLKFLPWVLLGLGVLWVFGMLSIFRADYKDAQRQAAIDEKVQSSQCRAVANWCEVYKGQNLKWSTVSYRGGQVYACKDGTRYRIEDANRRKVLNGAYVPIFADRSHDIKMLAAATGCRAIY